tara:strand:- start:74 stop:226 length:153 start_codon:yes stop_codon:yes gene_type:complete
MTDSTLGFLPNAFCNFFATFFTVGLINLNRKGVARAADTPITEDAATVVA